MEIAKLPRNESARLQALNELKILDTLPESEYDDLVRIAACICGTPTALISLIDDKRQWFKARIGLDAQETPRDFAFCAHAIHSAEPFMVADASKDSRFDDNPLVVGGPEIRFYAGAPLVMDDDVRLGTLCVIDKVPRELNAEQIFCLEALGRQVSSLLKLRRQAILLDDQASELERSNTELDQFAYAVSHDLREPLRTVSGFASLLSRRSRDALGSDGQEFVDLIIEGAGRMSRMIDGVLAVSRVGRNKDDMGPVALDAALDEALANLEERVLESGAVIEREALPMVIGLHGQLVQLFQNLLANAIKFAKPDKSPRIRISATNEAGMTQVDISDNGRGISDGSQAHLFTLFRRGEAVGDVEGTGIGLAMCKRIVDAHAGEISIASPTGDGATLRFSLPLAAATEDRV